MVPRDQFNRMAALALVAILLLLTFACRAYAAEITFMDSGPAEEQGQEEVPDESPEELLEELPEDETPEDENREEAPGEFPGDEQPEDQEEEEAGAEEEVPDLPQSADSGTLLKEITQIRQMLELLICFVVPFICAVWLVYKFCMWFYYTFIRTAF